MSRPDRGQVRRAHSAHLPGYPATCTIRSQETVGIGRHKPGRRLQLLNELSRVNNEPDPRPRAAGACQENCTVDVAD